MKLNIQLVTAAVLSVGCSAECISLRRARFTKACWSDSARWRHSPVRCSELIMFTKRKEIKMETKNEERDWVKVLYEVILKILTLGFYHVEKHRKK